MNISWEILWKLFFMVLLGWILFLARDIVAALILAIVISTAFDPVVTFLEKKRIPRIIGTLLIYLIAIFLIGLIIYAFVPIALSELTNLLAQANKFFGPAGDTFDVQSVFEQLNLSLKRLTDLLFSGSISVVDIAIKFLGGVFSVIAIFVLSFYLTVGREGVSKFLIAILPSASEAKAINIYTRVEKKIARWLAGQLFISLLVGLLTFLGLWILGVKYSLLFGILAAILELVPYVGPVFTGAVAVLLGLDTSVSLGISVLVLFIIIQQLENHVFVPLVNKYTTALNPVVVLVALLVGGKIFGLVGIILSVPVAVFFQELVEDWADHKQMRRGLGL